MPDSKHQRCPTRGMRGAQLIPNSRHKRCPARASKVPNSKHQRCPTRSMRGAQLIPDLCSEIPKFPDFSRLFPTLPVLARNFMKFPDSSCRIPTLPVKSRRFPIFPVFSRFIREIVKFPAGHIYVLGRSSKNDSSRKKKVHHDLAKARLFHLAPPFSDVAVSQPSFQPTKPIPLDMAG